MSKISILLRLLSSFTIPPLQYLSQNSKQPSHKTLDFIAAMSDDTSFSPCDQSNDCPPSYNTLDNLSYTISDNFCNTASEPPPNNPSDHILSPLPACLPDVHQSTNHFSAPSDPNYYIEAASHTISAYNTTNIASSALHSNTTEVERSNHISAAEALHDTRTALTTSRLREEPSEEFKVCCVLVLALVIIIIVLSVFLANAKRHLKDGKCQGRNAHERQRDDWNALNYPVGGRYRGHWGH